METFKSTSLALATYVSSLFFFAVSRSKLHINHKVIPYGLCDNYGSPMGAHLKHCALLALSFTRVSQLDQLNRYRASVPGEPFDGAPHLGCNWFMSKSETIRARVAPKTKREAEQIFEKLGLTATDAITMFYHQVKRHRGLPFDVKIPNKETQEAMQDARSRKNVKRFSNIDDLKAEFE